MAIHIVQLGKYRFVCGLFWQSLSRPRELRKEAIELAKKMRFDLMVLRTDQNTANAGFAAIKEGAREGMFSLAAVVSKTVALGGVTQDGNKKMLQHWLGAFKLPDGKWFYVAVRDQNFLPNGDFCGTREEVLERLLADYALGGWSGVIAEPELEGEGFHNFIGKRILDLLPHRGGQIRAHRWWRLVPVKRKVPWAMLGGIGALAAAAAGGFMYWEHLKQQQLEEEQARAFEQARQKMAEIKAAAPVEEVRPWAAQPLPEVLAQVCIADPALLSPGGWTLDEFACTSGGIQYAWSRAESNITYLMAALPDASIDGNGEKATYTQALRIDQGTDEELMSYQSLRMTLLSRFQQVHLPVQITAAGPQQESGLASLPGMSAIPGLSGSQKPSWQTYRITVTAGLPPAELAGMLSLPGVRAERIAYKNGEWTIGGIIYAK